MINGEKHTRGKGSLSPVARIGRAVCSALLTLGRGAFVCARWAVSRGEENPVGRFVREARRCARALEPRLDRSLLRPRAALHLLLAVQLAAPSVLPMLGASLLGVLASVVPSRADIARRINFQGRLTDTSNNPRSGTFTLK